MLADWRAAQSERVSALVQPFAKASGPWAVTSVCMFIWAQNTASTLNQWCLLMLMPWTKDLIESAQCQSIKTHKKKHTLTRCLASQGFVNQAGMCQFEFWPPLLTWNKKAICPHALYMQPVLIYDRSLAYVYLDWWGKDKTHAAQLITTLCAKLHARKEIINLTFFL